MRTVPSTLSCAGCADGQISAGVLIDGGLDAFMELYVESQDEEVFIELSPLTVAERPDRSISYSGDADEPRIC